MLTGVCKKCCESFVTPVEAVVCQKCRAKELEVELADMTKSRDDERKRGDEATSLLMAKVAKVEAQRDTALSSVKRLIEGLHALVEQQNLPAIQQEYIANLLNGRNRQLPRPKGRGLPE